MFGIMSIVDCCVYIADPARHITIRYIIGFDAHFLPSNTKRVAIVSTDVLMLRPQHNHLCSEGA